MLVIGYVFCYARADCVLPGAQPITYQVYLELAYERRATPQLWCRYHSRSVEQVIISITYQWSRVGLSQAGCQHARKICYWPAGGAEQSPENGVSAEQRNRANSFEMDSRKSSGNSAGYIYNSIHFSCVPPLWEHRLNLALFPLPIF